MKATQPVPSGFDDLSPEQQAAVSAAVAAFSGDAGRLAAAVVEYAEHLPAGAVSATDQAPAGSPLPGVTAGSLPTLSSLRRKPKPEAIGPIVAELHNVTRRYKMGHNQVQAVNNASLSIHQGEFVAIIGSSGSGKSTVLNLLGGLDRPDSGTVTVAGQDLAQLSDAKLSRYRNQTIGFVFQFFYLQPFLTVAANLEVPAMFGRLPMTQRRERVTELAKAVGLTDRLTHLPRELSGGQMQRAAIARALMNQPKILLADEPTGNLDSTNSRGIMELFQQVRQEFGTTIIVVTHDEHIAAAADRTITMHDGGVISA
jgi:ABC-type lipoprotein export system ATPase subunit